MVIEVNSLAFGRGNILFLILTLLLKLLVTDKIVAIFFLPLLIEFMRVLNLDFVDEMFNSFVILVFVFMFLLHLQQLLFLVLYLLRQFEQRFFVTIFVLTVCQGWTILFYYCSIAFFQVLNLLSQYLYGLVFHPDSLFQMQELGFITFDNIHGLYLHLAFFKCLVNRGNFLLNLLFNIESTQCAKSIELNFGLLELSKI